MCVCVRTSDLNFMAAVVVAAAAAVVFGSIGERVKHINIVDAVLGSYTRVVRILIFCKFLSVLEDSSLR